MLDVAFRVRPAGELQTLANSNRSVPSSTRRVRKLSAGGSSFGKLPGGGLQETTLFRFVHGHNGYRRPWRRQCQDPYIRGQMPTRIAIHRSS
jgi:hypothetical protein